MRFSPRGGYHLVSPIAFMRAARAASCRSGERLVDGDEPLRRGAEDHRRLGAPANADRNGAACPWRAACRASISSLITAPLASPSLPSGVRMRLPAKSGTCGVNEPSGCTTLKASGFFARIVAVRLEHQLEIFFAMAGRGVDEAGAGVGGDDVRPAAAARRSHSPGCGRDARNQRSSSSAVNRAHPAQRHLGMLGDLLGQRIGQQQFFARLRQRALGCVRDLIERRRKSSARRRWRDCREWSRASSSRSR